MQRKGLDIFLKILKVLIPVALVAFLIFCGYDLVDIYLEDLKHIGEEGTYVQGYGLSFVVLLILGLVYNGIVLAFSVVGLIASLLYKNSISRKKNVVTFVLLCVSPVVTELLLVGMYYLIPVIVG